MIDIYTEIASLSKKGISFAICTIVETEGSVPRHAGTKMLVYADGTHTGTVGGGEIEDKVSKEAIKAMQTGLPTMGEYSLMPDKDDPSSGLCGGKVKIYIEPVIPAEKLVIFGAGHVGKAVAALAKLLNLRVIVCDDRDGMCNKEVFPNGDEFFEVEMAKLPDLVNIDVRTYLIVVTRGADVDIEGLPALLKTQAKYIGVMGSKRRWEATERGLFEKGVDPEALSRIKRPIGLDIKGETPEEIAVSILAEIIQVKHENVSKKES